MAHNSIEIARDLGRAVDALEFAEPVTHVYNPLGYAWSMHEQYLQKYGQGKRRYLLMGMNPGPWGMVQTGVPFGEVSSVRDFLKLKGEVGKPKLEHPKRIVEGLQCSRSEVSGRRLWGWAQDTFGEADRFFDEFLVVNYCPLVFMEASAKNRTPDKLPVAEQESLLEACDGALRRLVEYHQPELVIGVGVWAEKCAKRALGREVGIGRILHPSPASPVANRGWAPQASAQLKELGVVLP